MTRNHVELNVSIFHLGEKVSLGMKKNGWGQFKTVALLGPSLFRISLLIHVSPTLLVDSQDSGEVKSVQVSYSCVW